MGAWGTGNFENDQAADFVAELVAAKDTDPIKTAVEQILFATEESLDADLASRGLAAAEVVAALRRHPGDVPDEVSEWVSGRIAASVELRMMAHSVVIKVLNDSELRELWEETDDFDRWREVVRNLLKRLSLVKPGAIKAVAKALPRTGKLTSYLCCLCGEGIRSNDLTALSIKRKWRSEEEVYAHGSCLDDVLILVPRGNK